MESWSLLHLPAISIWSNLLVKETWHINQANQPGGLGNKEGPEKASLGHHLHTQIFKRPHGANKYLYIVMVTLQAMDHQLTSDNWLTLAGICYAWSARSQVGSMSPQGNHLQAPSKPLEPINIYLYCIGHLPSHERVDLRHLPFVFCFAWCLTLCRVGRLSKGTTNQNSCNILLTKEDERVFPANKFRGITGWASQVSDLCHTNVSDLCHTNGCVAQEIHQASCWLLC